MTVSVVARNAVTLKTRSTAFQASDPRMLLSPGHWFDDTPENYQALNAAQQGPSSESITEARLKSLLQALPAGVVVLDGEGRVQECNPAAIDLLDEPLQGEIWRNVIARAFDPKACSSEDAVTRKGRIVSISTCPLGEHIPGQIILLQDVTEKRHMQARIDQQQRLASMGQMAAQLAHQIRTPLSAALLYASHLRQPRLADSMRQRYAEKILTRIQRLEGLVNDMLLFARNNMEKREQLSVRTLINDIVQALDIPSMPETFRLTVQNHCRSERCISGNRNLLVSAIVNLVTNARQVMNDNGNVSIEIVSMVKDSIDFIVTDNGPGVAPEQSEKIFEPFYTTREKGTGLGLAVVKAVAHAHHGAIWLDTSVSKGARFVVRLPVQACYIKNQGEAAHA